MADITKQQPLLMSIQVPTRRLAGLHDGRPHDVQPAAARFEVFIGLFPAAMTRAPGIASDTFIRTHSTLL